MSPNPQVHLNQNELAPLKIAMGDVQIATADYYLETGRNGDLGAAVRTFLAKAQTLNDLLTNQIADSASYKALFTAPTHNGANLINAVKYVRNVSQHVLHVVRPRDDTLIGGPLAMRAYAYWEDIPMGAHDKLNKGTQKLRPAYDATLKDEEVTGTMVKLLGFFADILPAIVHRNQRGEWTGFPLTSHPNVPTLLHPEEPADLAAAQSWLDGRMPNGDARVVCGQKILDEVCYIVGLTFTGQHSFAPFVETVSQANHDIQSGFLYLSGDTLSNVEDVSTQFPQALQSNVIRSHDDLSSWTTSITHVEEGRDWCQLYDAGFWYRLVRMEHPGIFPDKSAYLNRRGLRLNALVPQRM